MICPVCRRGRIESFNHEICGRCGIHLGYEDCMGGLFSEADAHAILREGYIEAGEPDWSQNLRPNWSRTFLQSLHPFSEKAVAYLAEIKARATESQREDKIDDSDSISNH